MVERVGPIQLKRTPVYFTHQLTKEKNGTRYPESATMSDYEISVNSDNRENHSRCKSRIVSTSRRSSDADGPREKKRKMELGYDFIIREAEVDAEPKDDVKEQSVLKVKQWVRLKRGLYENDIAQVNYVDLARKEVQLKLLPRIDYTMPRGALNTTLSKPKTMERMKRSPAKPFDSTAIRAIGGEVTSDGDFFIFDGNRYCHSG